MGRPKSSANRDKHDKESGGGSSSSKKDTGGHPSSSTADVKVKDMLKELHGLIHQVQVPLIFKLLEINFPFYAGKYM